MNRRSVLKRMITAVVGVGLAACTSKVENLTPVEAVKESNSVVAVAFTPTVITLNEIVQSSPTAITTAVPTAVPTTEPTLIFTPTPATLAAYCDPMNYTVALKSKEGTKTPIHDIKTISRTVGDELIFVIENINPETDVRFGLYAVNGNGEYRFVNYLLTGMDATTSLVLGASGKYIVVLELDAKQYQACGSPTAIKYKEDAFLVELSSFFLKLSHPPAVDNGPTGGGNNSGEPQPPPDPFGPTQPGS
jgi:hypothetical protein